VRAPLSVWGAKKARCTTQLSELGGKVHDNTKVGENKRKTQNDKGQCAKKDTGELH